MDDLMIIIDELKDVLENVDKNEVEALIEALTKDKRIFVDGEGRSGYVGKCFTMRLMHLGFSVYALGESTTPSFSGGNDVLVAISGSGNAASVISNAQKAEKAGAKIFTITNSRQSKLVDVSDAIIQINATVRGDEENRKSIQLLGSLFDQSVHILLDYVCLAISKREHISNTEATKNHV